MGRLLILLPLAAFALIFLLAQAAGLGQAGPDRDPRGPSVLAMIGWGVLVAGFSEGLGAMGLLNRIAIALAWLTACGLLLGFGLRRNSIRKALRQLRAMTWIIPGWELVLMAGTGALLVLLLVIALVSPPNNVDSLLYHMSRVMHWAQNGSLHHYATGYHHQLIMPPFAEMAILTGRLLFGDDRMANLVQWSSLIGSLVAVSAIARLLGARSGGQMLAAVFAATLPMGVLQATSTQNDMVLAVFTLCCAYLVFLDRNRPLVALERVALGLAFGLGLLTKVTFTVYGLPLAALYAVGVLHRRGWRRGIVSVVTVGAVACLLNLPTWARNVATYRGLYGPPGWMQTKLALPQLADSLNAANPGGGSPPRLAPVRAALLFPLRRWAQAAALNLVSPSLAVNQVVWSALDSLPGLFQDVVSTSLTNAAWSHEDTAGNPLHLAIVLACGVALVILYRRGTASDEALSYLTAALVSFLLLPLVLKRGSSGFGIRYQLPFFMLSAPVVGLTLAHARWERWGRALGMLLLLSAVPYVLFNNTRPVIGRPPWPTRVRSVFDASEEELLFAANPQARAGYEKVTDWIKQSACRQVGLRLDSGDLEYQFWWLLDAPQSGIRLETVYTYSSLEHLLDPQFTPCAVICTICGDRAKLGDLSLALDEPSVKLYASTATDGSP